MRNRPKLATRRGGAAEGGNQLGRFIAQLVGVLDT